jgi:hypothetical protein
MKELSSILGYNAWGLSAPSYLSAGLAFFPSEKGSLIRLQKHAPFASWAAFKHDLPDANEKIRHIYGCMPGEGKIFCMSESGRLWELWYDREHELWEWADHGSTPEGACTTGGVVLESGELHILSRNANIWARWYDQALKKWTWLNLGRPAPNIFPLSSSSSFANASHHICDNGNYYQLSRTSGIGNWTSLGHP